MKQLQITANEGAHFFEVALCDSAQEAAADAAKCGCAIEFNAIVAGRVYNEPPAAGCLGRIIFSSQDFAPSIVQHELLHAAMLYERNVFGNPGLCFSDIEAEERLAYTQQALLDELLFKMEEAGLQEFGVEQAEEAKPGPKPMVLDDSNSDALPDGARLYPKLKPKQAEINAAIIADSKQRLDEAERADRRAKLRGLAADQSLAVMARIIRNSSLCERVLGVLDIPLDEVQKIFDLEGVSAERFEG